MKDKLTKEENEISDGIARGDYRSISKSGQKHYSIMAQNDIERRKLVRKEGRMNVRLTCDDLTHLKEKAKEEGLPYQTLVSSILHKYLVGALIDIKNLSAFRKVLGET